MFLRFTVFLNLCTAERHVIEALNWILKDNVVTSVLVGASKASQLLENIKIVDRTPFTEDELERIDEIVSQMQ